MTVQVSLMMGFLCFHKAAGDWNKQHCFSITHYRPSSATHSHTYGITKESYLFCIPIYEKKCNLVYILCMVLWIHLFVWLFLQAGDSCIGHFLMPRARKMNNYLFYYLDFTGANKCTQTHNCLKQGERAFMNTAKAAITVVTVKLVVLCWIFIVFPYVNMNIIIIWFQNNDHI